MKEKDFQISSLIYKYQHPDLLKQFYFTIKKPNLTMVKEIKNKEAIDETELDLENMTKKELFKL